ncbi:MAG: hypothetical protein AAFO15_01000 [Pseudomonadota bacterium]
MFKRAYELFIYYDINTNVSDMVLDKICKHDGKILKQEDFGFRKIRTPQKHNKLMISRLIIAISKDSMNIIKQFCDDHETIRRYVWKRFKSKAILKYVLENDSPMLTYTKTLIQ